ncbi:helix-turn-helix transcriptional regulator [Amycolatopsis halotolerans]|uniref:Helix-turn-helix transcriptional regulator n=2 Tax=Amycolatopsis halotolerans TaxID=330083 RepID=A0ABV7QF18_9PSEU
MPESATAFSLEKIDTPTMDLPDACVAFGISRSYGYELAKRGEFPARVIKLGTRYRVVTSSVREVLGQQGTGPGGAAA